ncbi:O-acetylserine/cysteine exporter [Silvimonas sp. JCM 19000]
MPIKDWITALTVIVVWGVNFVVIKLGLHGVPPMLLGALRFCLVVFPAILFVPRPKVAWRWLLLYGASISLGQFAFLFSAIYVGMPAGLASLVLQAQAFFTVILAAIFMHEAIRWHHLTGMLVSACGLALIGSGATTGSFSLAGFGLTLCGALCWATGNLTIKKIGAVNPLSLVVWGGLVPPLPFFALSYLLEGPARISAALAHFSLNSFLAVSYLAYFATGVGYMLWGRLLGKHPVGRIAPLTLLVPVVGLISASLLLDERLSALQWLGGAVVMLGLLINVFGPRWLAARTLTA